MKCTRGPGRFLNHSIQKLFEQFVEKHHNKTEDHWVRDCIRKLMGWRNSTNLSCKKTLDFGKLKAKSQGNFRPNFQSCWVHFFWNDGFLIPAENLCFKTVLRWLEPTVSTFIGDDSWRNSHESGMNMSRYFMLILFSNADMKVFTLSKTMIVWKKLLELDKHHLNLSGFFQINVLGGISLKGTFLFSDTQEHSTANLCLWRNRERESGIPGGLGLVVFLCTTFRREMPALKCWNGMWVDERKKTGKKLGSSGRKSRTSSTSHFFSTFLKGRFSQDQRELGPNCVFRLKDLFLLFAFKAHLIWRKLWVEIVVDQSTRTMWFVNQSAPDYLASRAPLGTFYEIDDAWWCTWPVHHMMTWHEPFGIVKRETYTFPSFFLPFAFILWRRLSNSWNWFNCLLHDLQDPRCKEMFNKKTSKTTVLLGFLYPKRKENSKFTRTFCVFWF